MQAPGGLLGEGLAARPGGGVGAHARLLEEGHLRGTAAARARGEGKKKTPAARTSSLVIASVSLPQKSFRSTFWMSSWRSSSSFTPTGRLRHHAGPRGAGGKRESTGSEQGDTGAPPLSSQSFIFIALSMFSSSFLRAVRGSATRPQAYRERRRGVFRSHRHRRRAAPSCRTWPSAYPSTPSRRMKHSQMAARGEQGSEQG